MIFDKLFKKKETKPFKFSNLDKFTVKSEPTITREGIDQKKMVIIEIDEKHHFNANGKLKQKDIDRQKYLQKLGYEFIRIRI